jgi:tetratricopeptide (TPR) repeat protein
VKKETLLTIVVFLGVGFLGGYVYGSRKNSGFRTKDAASAVAPAPAEANASASSASLGMGLPQGHPPVNAEEIIHFFENAAAQNPKNPEPRVKLADFLYDQQRWAEAIPWYRQSLDLNPQNVDARTDLATCYFNLGQFDRALQQLNEAIKVDPHHEATLFNLIVVNMEGTHNFKAAEQAWQQLREINPGYPNLDQIKQSLDAEIAASKTAPR